MVDDLQNKNQDLIKQIKICKEENKILDKMHRQKVVEVEKLSLTVRELEEAVLAGGGAANAVRDYQRKVQEMNDEMKTLDRELSRAKVSANRVVVVVANEWKDANDRVMSVKQWVEDRRFMQGEMQQLRDKLTIFVLIFGFQVECIDAVEDISVFPVVCTNKEIYSLGTQIHDCSAKFVQAQVVAC
ncbi:Microtubule-associated protein 70-2 [Platanthera zijinensis]|uniref:Microtubule-associated protein 70-2 n=1 Tax=Platanthera zijinensis TaxID=2320716 RepID=A0AAP0GGH2_9ASPA